MTTFHESYEAPDRDSSARPALDLRGVEPRSLEALVALERERSFRTAAAAIGLAQSAFSQRIIQLEQRLGQRVVVRSRGRAAVSLTPAGTVMARYAGAILAHLEAAWCDLTALTGERRVRVGVLDGVSERFLPTALRALADHPEPPAVELHEQADVQQLAAHVCGGELDVAFAELPLERGPFAWQELAVDRWVLVVRADSPLARAPEPPSLAEIGALPLLAWHGARLDAVEACLRCAGVQPRFVFGSRSAVAVQELVAQGAGAALLPSLWVSEHDERIAALAPTDALPPRRVVVYWHRDRLRTETIETFLSALRAPDASVATASRHRMGAVA